MIHDLGHVIAADLGVGDGGAPIPGGGTLLGGLSALQDARGIGRVEEGRHQSEELPWAETSSS